MKSKKVVSSRILAFPVLILLVACGHQKTTWEGTIEVVNGVTVVKNPKEPMYEEETFGMEEELDIGEAEGREEYMFQSIRTVAISDNGDIYVLDSKAQHIKVYNNEGEYLRTIGRPSDRDQENYIFPLTSDTQATERLS